MHQQQCLQLDNAATLDDGSCVFCGCEDDAGNVYSMTVEPSAATVDGLTRHRFYVNMLNADDTFSAVFGNAEHPCKSMSPKAHTTLDSTPRGTPPV